MARLWVDQRSDDSSGPMVGREGKLLTARQIWERLVRETRTIVALEVADTDTAGHFEVKARAEMQIAILVEQMRRESFELPPCRSK